MAKIYQFPEGESPLSDVVSTEAILGARDPNAPTEYPSEEAREAHVVLQAMLRHFDGAFDLDLPASSLIVASEVVEGYELDEITSLLRNSSKEDWMKKPAFYRELALRFLMDVVLGEHATEEESDVDDELDAKMAELNDLSDEEVEVAKEALLGVLEHFKMSKLDLAKETRELRSEIIAGYSLSELVRVLGSSRREDWMKKPAFYIELVRRCVHDVFTVEIIDDPSQQEPGLRIVPTLGDSETT